MLSRIYKKKNLPTAVLYMGTRRMVLYSYIDAS